MTLEAGTEVNGTEGSRIELAVERGALAGRVIPLQLPKVILGRGGEMGPDRIALSDPAASRQHACLQSGPEGWSLVDLESTNGTYLNGQRLPAHRLHLLHPGDRITIGGEVLLVREAQAVDRAMELSRPRPKNRTHPAVLVAGAFLLVAMLVGMVILLVSLLQPQAELATPTAGSPVELLVTALPVPTEFQEAATAVIPLLATSLPLPFLGPASTPTPESAWPQDEILYGSSPAPAREAAVSQWYQTGFETERR